MDEAMTHARLAEIMADGAAFVVESAIGGVAAPSDADQSWPVAIIGANGSFAFIGPEQPGSTAAGDLLVRLYRPALAPTPVDRRGRLRALARRLMARADVDET